MLRATIRPAVVLFAALTVVTGVIYPLLMTGVAQIVFPHQAAGSLIENDGKLLGSVLIGQAFTDPKYFWSRPSATSPQPYNGVASSGSNLGPLNPALIDAVKTRIDTLHAVDPMNQLPIPIDLVTASAGGLDPHISVAAAKYQLERVARIRGVSIPAIQTLIAANTEDRLLGFIGEPRVNVLRLNLALDTIAPVAKLSSAQLSSLGGDRLPQ